MKQRFYVKQRTLLLIAGLVWLMAGFNVARLGVLSYRAVVPAWYLYLLSAAVFLLFAAMFYRMSKKHTRRILGYQARRPFWHFFDRRAYVLMACMMGGGIGLRAAGVFPTGLSPFSTPASAVRWPWRGFCFCGIISGITA